MGLAVADVGVFSRPNRAGGSGFSCSPALIQCGGAPQAMPGEKKTFAATFGIGQDLRRDRNVRSARSKCRLTH